MKKYFYYTLITKDLKLDRQILDCLKQRFKTILTRNSYLIYHGNYPKTPYEYFYIDSKTNTIGCCNYSTIDYRKHSNNYIVKEIKMHYSIEHVKIGIPLQKITIF